MSGLTETLKINPALRLLVLPLTPSEYASLEQEILTVGNQRPVQCWYQYLISDFERVEISQRNNIPFEVNHTNFCTEIEIVAQICERELKNPLLPSDMRRYLIGKLYNAEKIIAAHRVAGTDRYKEKRGRELSHAKTAADVRLVHIRERLGSRYHLNPATVTRYATYADGIDIIFQHDVRMASQILNGTVKLPVDVVRGYAISASATEKSSLSNDFSRSSASTLTGPSVKDMPAFDPDAEINSLTLTIPSWIQSLNRTHSTEKLSLITEGGRTKLKNELRHLISVASKLDSALEVKLK